MSPIRIKPFLHWPAAALLLLAGTVLAQQDTVRLNYRNTDLQEVVEAVAEATGRNFVIDPQVGADRKVNLFGSQPLSPEAYYQAFLSMLSAHGIVGRALGAGHPPFSGPDHADLCRRRPGVIGERRTSDPGFFP